MGRGKHSDYEEIDFTPIKNGIFIIVALIFIIAIIFGAFRVIKKFNDNKKIQTSSEEENIFESSYDIFGKIMIDKIHVEQNIFDTTDEKALEEGVIKLYGNGLNQIGNLCIAGHNQSGIFQELDELEINDDIKIQDKDKQVFVYRITEIYSVEPTDLNPLKQQTEKKEITLITCENYSTKRLIVKAEAEENI